MGEVSDTEQQYSLRWNDFHASILSSFRHLRDEEDFVDVTLACDGCSFTAHKVVLSACSPYFRRLLKANPCQHPIVILRDVKEKDMESLLRFMYNGEVHIGQEQLSDFLKTAQMLQVRGLADVPTKDNQKIPSTSNSLPWSQSGELRENFPEEPLTPPTKRSRNNEHRFSPSPASSATNNNNNNGDPLMRDTLLGQALEGGPTIYTGSTSHQNKGNSDSSLQAQSTGEESNSSDSNSEQGASTLELVRPKAEPNDYSSMDDNHHHHGNGGLGLDPTRSFPAAALLGLQNIPGLLPGPSGLHNNSQDTNFGAGAGTGSGDGLSGPGRSFECPLCDAVVIELPAMRAHLEEHYPRDSPTCPVSTCAKAFSHPNSVRNHMRMKHAQQWDKMKTLKWSYM